MPGNAEDPAVVRRQGPDGRCQAAELLAEPELDEDEDEDVEEDAFVSDDEAAGFDAGVLLDVEPRESLR